MLCIIYTVKARERVQKSVKMGEERNEMKWNFSSNDTWRSTKWTPAHFFSSHSLRLCTLAQTYHHSKLSEVYFFFHSYLLRVGNERLTMVNVYFFFSIIKDVSLLVFNFACFLYNNIFCIYWYWNWNFCFNACKSGFNCLLNFNRILLLFFSCLQKTWHHKKKQETNMNS